jgi:hypothetical protein
MEALFLWVYFTELINLTDVEGLQTVELMGYHQRKTLLDQLSDHIFAGFFVAGLVHFKFNTFTDLHISLRRICKYSRIRK